MKQSKAGRVLAALLLGVLFGIYRHVREVHMLASGRDAFLAQQSRSFDSIARVHSLGLMLIAGIILAAIAVGLYELTAMAIARILPPSTVEE